MLEAAHISPYLGDHTNVVANGMLLSRDVHTLFDLHLLTVALAKGQYVVRVAPAVTAALYQQLDQRPARVPSSADLRPSTAELVAHNVACPRFF